MKNLILFLFSFLLGGLCNHYFFGKKNHTEVHKRIVKDSFDIFTDKEPLEELISSYYASDYIKTSNDKKFSYQDFLKNVQEVKKEIQSIDITWENVVSEKDKVCTSQIVNAVKKNGSKVSFKILALHKIKEEKIISTEASTQMIDGSKEDVEFGSRF